MTGTAHTFHDQGPPVDGDELELESLNLSPMGGSVLEGSEPTEEEARTLVRVSDKLPWSAGLIAVIEVCERFAFYGASGPFQNYLQNEAVNAEGKRGAIGLGQRKATGLNNLFQLWCYLTPILGAIVADQYLGRYKTIVYCFLLYLTGLLILFLTSLPVAIEHDASLGGWVAAMILIGLGAGGMKTNVGVLISEQYRGDRATVRTRKNGTRIIVDPALTIERIYMVFYFCINIGSLSSIATTELESHVGFWAAYLLPMLMFCVGFIMFILGRKTYVVHPPKGSVIPDAFRVIWVSIVNRGNLEAAKSSYQEERGRRHQTPWTDLFVDEIRRALVACKVFLFLPVYWLVHCQMHNNFISQAGTMELHGIPNDIMQSINPMTVIIFVPILDRLIYPALRRRGIQFKPITRITWAFLLGAASVAYAAVIQHLIYRARSCDHLPSADRCSSGHRLHVAIQLPAYILTGLSGIFANVTGLEYAYTKAPPSMKSFVMSLFLLTVAFASALGLAISPTATDPKLVWMYTGLAIAAFVSGILFWRMNRQYNATEESMNALEGRHESVHSVNELGPTLHRRERPA
ncbi:MAG: hypothetical protein M1823_004766 [Watsoniomyces obsoletus]|nr:MAG: hypothetical protein M1823_004766 [Watsoniomyces obsoletus]